MSPGAGMLLWGKAPGLEEGFSWGCWDMKEGKTPLSGEREGSRRGTHQFCPTSQTCTETLISRHLMRKLTSSLLFCVFSSKCQVYTSSGSKCTAAGTWSRLSTFRSLFGEAWGKMNWGIILSPWEGQVFFFAPWYIVFTYETTIATCPPYLRYGKPSILAIPPKQGLTSESSSQVCVGNLALCSTGSPRARHLAALGFCILSVNQR